MIRTAILTVSDKGAAGERDDTTVTGVRALLKDAFTEVAYKVVPDEPEQVRAHLMAWADDDRLTEDPQRDISLIYYPDKGGLQDRVFRIRTERSSATSLPEPRTSHNISNVEVISRSGDLVDVRFNWHTMYFRYKTVDPYYGTTFCTLDFSGSAPLIRRKTVVLKNDYIHHVVDVYHF